MEELLTKLNEAEQKYYINKMKLNQLKADLWINTDFPTVIGKTKPTEKDKNNWITLQVTEEEENVIMDMTSYYALQRLYELEKDDKLNEE